MRLSIYLLFISIIAFSSCISKKEYEDLKASKKYYEEEAAAADSIRMAYRDLYEKYRQTDAQLKAALEDLEQKVAANASLNQNYLEILEKYNRLLDQNQNILSTSTYEKQNLQEQLAAQQAELDKRARDLALLEYNVNEREARLIALEGSYSNIEGNLAERNRRVIELEALLSTNEQAVTNLRSSVSEALKGFTAADLTVEEKNGRLYVSLSQELLFKSGSDVIDWKGKKALSQLAQALNKNPAIDIIVEGHTDTDGTASSNWDLSVKRATAVVKVLTTAGVDPKRVTASGRASYLPIATNTTAKGKAMNRRTEIILSPKLDQLYQLIDR